MFDSGLPEQVHDHRGRFFCTAFLENTPGGIVSSPIKKLYITTDESVSVNFTIRFGATHGTASGTAMPNQFTDIVVPNSVELIGSIVTNAVEISVTSPVGKISVYAMNDDLLSSDGFLVLPQDSYPAVTRYDYIILSTSKQGTGTVLGNSIFATANCINFTPDMPRVMVTVPPQFPSMPLVTADFVILPPGETFAPGNTVTYNTPTVEDVSFFLFSPNHDLTGWRVNHPRPLALVTGHACGQAPVDKSGCDHLSEHLPPVYAWGYNVFTVPQSMRFGELYRVISLAVSDINITCTTNGSTTPNPVIMGSIDPNGTSYFFQFSTNFSQYCCIQSNRPIIVMQYAYGHSVDENNPGKVDRDLGDPFMLTIAPVEQYINNISFTTDVKVNDQFNEGDFISVSVPVQFFNPAMIMLDDVHLTGLHWNPIICSNGSICGYGTNMPVSRGFHRVQHLNPEAGLFVSVYAWGDEVSWGFPGGFGLNPVGRK